jgi:hypothetical protein
MNDQQDQIAQRLAKYRWDPLGHVRWSYPWSEPGELLNHQGPRTWQREELSAIGEHLTNPLTRHTPYLSATASGHGIGKSALVAWLVRWAEETCVGAKCVVTANTEPQLRTKTWPEVAKWSHLALAKDWFDCTATALASKDPKHSKTWRADAITWSEHNTEAFAGMHNQGKRILLIFDEASAISDRVWEVAEGALTDQDTEILWLVFGNPTKNGGRFRECFRRLSHRWRHKQIDARTVEGTNAEEIAKRITDYGADSDYVKVRVLGQFPSSSFKQFISGQDVDAAFGRHLRPEQYNFAPKIITVDPAWTGEDELVIGMRQGLAFRILRVIPKNDNDMAIAQLVAQFEDDERADAVIIDGGFGTGIVSGGKTMGRNWLIAWFSGSSPDEGCLNLRAYMYKQARDWLKSGGAIPKDNDLRDELTGPETVPRMDGKIQIESKEDMKRRGLRSPNRADSLVLSFAFPVQSKADRGYQVGYNHRDQERDDYDPLHRKSSR